VAPGGPAGPHAQVSGMVLVANIDVPSCDRRALRLRVAAEAKVDVALDEQFGINRAVRRVAYGATFPQGRMLENKWPGLLPMTGGTGIVIARHGEPSGRFENVGPVGVMALGAIDMVFEQGMVLGQMKLGLDWPMAFETGAGIFAGVDNESAAAAATGDVQTSGSVAGFATGLPGGARVVQPDAGMGAGGENAANIGVAFGAGLIADEGRAGNVRGRDQGGGRGRTRVQQQSKTSGEAEGQRGKHEPAGSHEGRLVTAAALSICETISSERFPLVGKIICR
jgi:hypothetical protein